MRDWAVGQLLEPVDLLVDASVVAAYAEVARDPNPLHFSDTAARALGFPAAIAHGMISGALIMRMLASELGWGSERTGRLSLRFVAPVLVGQRVRTEGVVTAVAPLRIDVTARTDDGVVVITGTAELRG